MRKTLDEKLCVVCCRPRNESYEVESDYPLCSHCWRRELIKTDYPPFPPCALWVVDEGEDPTPYRFRYV